LSQSSRTPVQTTIVVGDRVAAAQDDGVLRRIEILRRAGDEADARWYEASRLAPGPRQGIGAGPDQREGGLVVMLLRWLDDGDVNRTRRTPLKARGDGDARGPAADDQDLMMGGSRHAVASPYECA
jgi:hypothetical protein